jgi:hypothetical protein
MIFPSRRRTARAMVLLLAVIMAVVSPAVALAQAPPGTPQRGASQDPPVRPTETRDDDAGYMDSGFDTWKDWIEILVIGIAIPVGLAAAAGVNQWLGQYLKKRSFQRIVLRELEEISPHPPSRMTNGQWNQHLKPKFMHQKIFDAPSENADFLLRLPQNLVYFVNQLWAAKDAGNSEQWLYFLCKLSCRSYDPKRKIKAARDQWKALINEYNAHASMSGRP